MARHGAGATSTNAGTSARPIGSLYSIAATRPRIREIGLFNTTDVSAVFKLVRLTNATGQGTALTEDEHDPDGSPPLCTAFNAHTADTGLGNDAGGYRAVLGAAKGSGIVWTFGDSGLMIPIGTANGVGIIPVGTGQVCEFYFVWDE